MDTSQTLQALDAMTDEGTFERLATAVLRKASNIYSSLAHPGVNMQGKTVKSPVDGIAFVNGANPPCIIVVHHTICAKSDLQKKWLLDPAIVRSRVRRSAAVPGDCLKAASIIAEERKRIPNLRATLVLTTNREPSEGLIRDVHAFAATYDFDLDLWPRSRLGNFLDHDPEGQWLRRAFFGIQPERLSTELLRELSRRNLELHRPSDPTTDAWIPRQLDQLLCEQTQNTVVFVVAASGLGKSVACYKRLAAHLQSGGCGLVLTHDLIASSATLEQAINAALHQILPSLVVNPAVQALSFCSSENPLLLVVEDVNKSGQALHLIQKLVNWGLLAIQKATQFPQSWQLLCPLWPDVISTLDQQARKQVEGLSVISTPFTRDESRMAVQLRAKTNGNHLSDIQADVIATALGHDPLLIALHEPQKLAQPRHIVSGFIDSCVARVAAKHREFTIPDYHSALKSLGSELLTRRQLDPQWAHIVSWLQSSSDMLRMLRHIIHDGVLIRLAGPPADQKLAFRHDRVRDEILAVAAADLIRKDKEIPATLSDPYFSEIVGAALLQGTLTAVNVPHVAEINPLALFHAFRLFQTPSADIHHVILKEIDDWLAKPEARAPFNAQLRWEILAALSEIESPRVLGFVQRIEGKGWNQFKARLRNGDFVAGLELCFSVGPGTSMQWRDSQIDHVKMHFGEQLSQFVSTALESPDLPSRRRIAALRLAGHLADPLIAKSIEASWTLDVERQKNLDEYLWAAARCCGEHAERHLSPLCDTWAALSDKTDKYGSSPRNNLGARELRFAFGRSVPTDAVPYFIARAKNEDLRWPITYMLHGVDHPDAVEFLAREMAEIQRRATDAKSFSPFVSTCTRHWRDQQERNGLRMSPISRTRLLSLWQRKDEDDHTRKQAFRLWAATHVDGDIATLRDCDPLDLLSDLVLWERLSRKDQSAIPALLKKFEEPNRSYWWQAGRRIWSDQMTTALAEHLSKRGASVVQNWNQTYEDDWITSEMVMELPPHISEEILLQNWFHLRFSPRFVQAALFVATPKLRELVAQSLKECPNPREMLKYLHSHFGIKTNGRKGVTRLEQLQAVEPYLDLLDTLDISDFWDVCNQNGWFEFRRKNLDARLKGMNEAVYFDQERINEYICDVHNSDQPIWIDHWIDEYLKAGATTREVLTTLIQWLGSKNDQRALELISQAFAHIARRSDLELLNILNFEKTPEALAIRANTTFAVTRKTVH